MYTLPEKDLEHILEFTSELWEELKGQRLFISGGTGFFGAWLTQSFLYANDFYGLGARVTLLTRKPELYRQKSPAIAAHPSIEICEGDVRDFKFPAGHYPYLIHAANESFEQIKELNPEKEHFEIITKGTERILEFAAKSGCKKLLFTSSGAVYGKQPPELKHIPESFEPSEQSLLTSYGKGKRIAEELCVTAASTHAFESKIARCFCFIGPYLPLNVNLAAGNFIRNALEAGPIHVNGDGTPFRSYLYTSDLTIWLWNILFRGGNGKSYNVGSEEAVSIIELANKISTISSCKRSPIVHKQANPRIAPERYVPDTKLARETLGLIQRVSLDDAIKKTLKWHSDSHSV